MISVALPDDYTRKGRASVFTGVSEEELHVDLDLHLDCAPAAPDLHLPLKLAAALRVQHTHVRRRATQDTWPTTQGLLLDLTRMTTPPVPVPVSRLLFGSTSTHSHVFTTLASQAELRRRRGRVFINTVSQSVGGHRTCVTTQD